MKTKLLFYAIQKFKNGIKLKGIFTFLIIFFMTFYSFSQSDGISFNCSGGIISFGTGPVENELFNGYSYWVGGTDNSGSGVEYLLFVQNVNGNDRWEVHETNPDPQLNFPNNIGTLWFSSTDYNVISPSCDSGAWLVDYNLLPCFGNSIVVDCVGEPIEVCPTYYADTDGDGFGDPENSISTCDEAPNGYVSNNTDCNDTITDGIGATIYPGAEEICDGFDNDCDDDVDEGFDSDNDGTADCFDTEECDGIDNDGDGQIDEDLDFTTYYADSDGDGFGDPDNTTSTCNGAPLGFVEDNTDCDDLEYEVYPGAPEICDGLDNNCDGQIDEGIAECIDGVIIEYCDDKQKKILVCHNGKTKCVSINAMDAHLAHGDYLGTCGGNSKQEEVLAEERPTSYNLVSWPNPTNDVFNVRMITPNYEDEVSLQAFDINGRLIHTDTINGNENYLFGYNLQAGIYFVKVTQAETTQVIKVIKQ